MRRQFEYRYLVRNEEAFVQQVQHYLSQGYVYYKLGQIGDGVDPLVADQVVLDGYGLRISKYIRARRKKSSGGAVANVQYLRLGRTWIILATKGRHVFFRREEAKNAKHAPIFIGGYSLRVIEGPSGKSHCEVAISDQHYRALLAYFKDIALKRNREGLEEELRSIPFTAWGPVKRQLRDIAKAVNRLRKQHKRVPVRVTKLPHRRKRIKVYARLDEAA